MFAEMAAYHLVAFDLTGANGPERAPSLRITADFFRTLGVKPALGRDLLDAEDQPGGRAVLLRIASGNLGRAICRSVQPGEAKLLFGVQSPDRQAGWHQPDHRAHPLSPCVEGLMMTHPGHSRSA